MSFLAKCSGILSQNTAFKITRNILTVKVTITSFSLPLQDLHTHICQIVFEVSPLQAVLLTVCVCGREGVWGGMKVCFDCTLVLCFVMGCVCWFGERKRKRVHRYFYLWGRGSHCELCAVQTAIAKGFHLVHVLAELPRYMLLS